MRGACGASRKAAVARQQSNTSDGAKNSPNVEKLEAKRSKCVN